MHSSHWQVHRITFNVVLTGTRPPAQAFMESKLEKKRRTRFGAPAGRKIVFFVDDVNMPSQASPVNNRLPVTCANRRN